MFLKKGSGAKYIKNRPYTANCPKRVRKYILLVNKISSDKLIVLDCTTVLNPIASEKHNYI